MCKFSVILFLVWNNIREKAIVIFLPQLRHHLVDQIFVAANETVG